jgi:drug/metabolite transporter (DMT)-like permease
MAAVLVAALLHASWNAVIKSGKRKALDIALVVCGAGLIAAATLFFLPLPATESLPYLVVSAVIQLAYFAVIAAVYRTGDLSYVYPIMRGSAPLLTAVVAGIFVAERLAPSAWAGIVCISAGILLLAAGQWRSGRFDLVHTLLALGNAALICIYTVVDGIGTRLSGNAFSYVGWMMALDGIAMAAFVSFRYRQEAIREFRLRWYVGLGGGFCAWASYGIALWAMTHAPVAMVAALRETSVIFATIIAAVVLKEKFSNVRYAAAFLVCAGAVLLKTF